MILPGAPLIAGPAAQGKRRNTRSGFTLIEVIVALALFALIAVAGFAILRGVLDTQAATETRLDRLSAVQRALFVIANDLDQASGRIEGDAASLTFQKTDAAGRPLVLRYAAVDGRLTRVVSGPAGERTQPLLDGVGAAAWSYRLQGVGWAPASGLGVDLVGVTPPVQAVSLDLTLTGVDGRPATVRRVMITPEVAG